MQQCGTIEFHGPKQMLNINNTLILLDKDHFIPGDKVYLDENNNGNTALSLTTRDEIRSILNAGRRLN
jgi:hypothetical protein